MLRRCAGQPAVLAGSQQLSAVSRRPGVRVLFAAWAEPALVCLSSVAAFSPSVRKAYRRGPAPAAACAWALPGAPALRCTSRKAYMP
jgi:hypothetical protein